MTRTPRRFSRSTGQHVSLEIRSGRQAYPQRYHFAAREEHDQNELPTVTRQIDSALFALARRRPRLLLAMVVAQIVVAGGLMFRTASPWMALAMVCSGGVLVWAGLRAIRLGGHHD